MAARGQGHMPGLRTTMRLLRSSKSVKASLVWARTSCAANPGHQHAGPEHDPSDVGAVFTVGRMVIDATELRPGDSSSSSNGENTRLRRCHPGLQQVGRWTPAASRRTPPAGRPWRSPPYTRFPMNVMAGMISPEMRRPSPHRRRLFWPASGRGALLWQWQSEPCPFTAVRNYPLVLVWTSAHPAPSHLFMGETKCEFQRTLVLVWPLRHW